MTMTYLCPDCHTGVIYHGMRMCPKCEKPQPLVDFPELTGDEDPDYFENLAKEFWENEIAAANKIKKDEE